MYRAVARPVLRETLAGYHGCIMAYGQTGSGKTHSLLQDAGPGGDLAQAGLLPRLAADLFTQISADPAAQFQVHVGMFQIYNEQVDDLLSPDNQNLKVQAWQLAGGRLQELSPPRPPLVSSHRSSRSERQGRAHRGTWRGCRGGRWRTQRACWSA